MHGLQHVLFMLALAYIVIRLMCETQRHPTFEVQRTAAAAVYHRPPG
jgi:hypothetical protein